MAGIFKDVNTLDKEKDYWIINSNGYAEFKDIHIKGGTMDWSKKAEETTESGQTVKKGGFQVSSIGEINAPSGRLGPWYLNYRGIYDGDKEVFIQSDGFFNLVNKTTNRGIYSTPERCGIVGEYIYIDGTDKIFITGKIETSSLATFNEIKASRIDLSWGVQIGSQFLDAGTLVRLIGLLE